MASISSIGIGSGLDAENIITQLVGLEKSRLTPLKAQANLIQTRLSTVSQLKSLAATLEDKLKALSDSKTWESAMAASSSNTDVMSASASGSPVAGSYDVQINSLAKAQSVTSGQFASDHQFAVGGTLKITVGSADPVSVNVSPDSSLSSVAAAINKANAGVTASILNDGTGQRLVLSASQTGTEHAFTISSESADLASLQYGGGNTTLMDSKSGNPSAVGALQDAANAEAVINGVTVLSQSNVFSDVIQGLSFTAATLGTSTLTVSTDTESLYTRINDFVTAYNALNSLLTTSTKYEESSQTGGIFQGDSSIVNLQNSLRRSFSESSNTSLVFSRLSDIGIDIEKGGKMAINESKVKDGLAKNAGEMAKFFAEGSEGFADKMYVFAKSIQDPEHVLSTKNDALNSAKKRNTQEQDKVNDRASAVEARLRAQYTALDTKMASLNALNAYVSQQVAQWNKRSD